MLPLLSMAMLWRFSNSPGPRPTRPKLPTICPSLRQITWIWPMGSSEVKQYVCPLSGQNAVEPVTPGAVESRKTGISHTKVPSSLSGESQISDDALRESASQLPIESPNDRWPLGFIASQLLVLRPLDHGDSLVLHCAACNRLLNGVTDIHQHLSITDKLFVALLGVGGKRAMSRHEDVSIEACSRLDGLEPVEAVAIVHE